jgi:hypothetical protein
MGKDESGVASRKRVAPENHLSGLTRLKAEERRYQRPSTSCCMRDSVKNSGWDVNKNEGLGIGREVHFRDKLAEPWFLADAVE